MTTTQRLLDNMPEILEMYKTHKLIDIALKFGTSKTMVSTAICRYLGISNMKEFKRVFKCKQCGVEFELSRIDNNTLYLCRKHVDARGGKQNLQTRFEEILKQRGLTYDKRTA